MVSCASCGQELGVGRYCTNCGAPVADWRTDTAERPRTPTPTPATTPAATPTPTPATTPAAAPTPVPPAPPPAWTPPPAPRFPLYADEVPEAEEPDQEATDHRRSRWTGGWIALAVVLVLVLVVGGWLLFAGDDDPPSAKQPSAGASTTGGKDKPDGKASSTAPTGLTAESQVTVPETAGSGQDVNGNPVTYDGANMLDGAPETCWRMPGDGTGEEIVVTLPRETRLRSVGMINGYAKKGGDVDWYHGNRRIEQVEWVFDDGTTVPQTLGDTEAVQSMDVDVTTTTITLRLVKVSAPGKGPSRRDFTAISDLLFVAR